MFFFFHHVVGIFARRDAKTIAISGCKFRSLEIDGYVLTVTRRSNFGSIFQTYGIGGDPSINEYKLKSRKGEYPIMNVGDNVRVPVMYK